MATFDDLHVLTEAADIADDIWNHAMKLDMFAKDTLGKQIVRAADSMGANLAESCGRFHFGDRLLFLYYSRGSLYETKYWIDRMWKRHLSSEAECKELIATLTDLAKRINRLIAGLKDVKNTSTVRGVKEEKTTYEVDVVAVDTDNIFDEAALLWLSTLGDPNFPSQFTPPVTSY